LHHNSIFYQIQAEYYNDLTMHGACWRVALLTVINLYLSTMHRFKLYYPSHLEHKIIIRV